MYILMYFFMDLSLSPWLFELNRKRPVAFLLDSQSADIVIVGGGIAGVSTAYTILENTNKSVLLLEAHKIAHGATGHNAGQVASYFEKPFADIVKEFGIDLACEGQQYIESGWEILEGIYKKANLQTPLLQFSGYAGCKSYEEVLYQLKDIAYHRQFGNPKESILIAKNAAYIENIPSEYKECYTLVEHHDILSLLETENTDYTATLVKRKGCLNSALFTEELVGYLLKTYSERFTLAEHTPVKHIDLHENDATLYIEDKDFTVSAKHVVLCTNGFEKLSITNKKDNTDIDTKFHHLVRGAVGYMAGYLAPRDKAPIAISYLPDNARSDDARDAEPYFYLTRRPFENEKKEAHNLICVGGPEISLDDTNEYKKESHEFKGEAEEMIEKFLHTTYASAPKGKIDYRFRWHGLMGYTPNGLRCIGFEPCNNVLLYNLGCNGVGILSSLYGAKRISQLLSGEKLKPSIFDPQDKNCTRE